MHILVTSLLIVGRRGRDRMVVGFTTTHVISVYHPQHCEFDSRPIDVYSIRHYVIKFACNLRPVSGFLQILRFSLSIHLTPRYNWNIIESCGKPQ